VRKGTLITGVILLVLGVTYVGSILVSYSAPESHVVPTGDRADHLFVRAIGPWNYYVSWSNRSYNALYNSADFTFYVTLDKPSSCTNVSGVIASKAGANGSLTYRVAGDTAWWMVLCDPIGHFAGFDYTDHFFAYSYYLMAGTGIGALGAVAIVVAFFQDPAPPITRPPSRPPTTTPPSSRP
jgi:hypothetical protein